MDVESALYRYDACRRARAGELADLAWVARVAQAEQKDFQKALRVLNREAGRAE